MGRLKLLVAPDLHTCTNLAAEIAANRERLPADTYDHVEQGTAYWHNELFLEAGEQLCEGLARLAQAERPDLLVFLGDLVNTNWAPNVTAVARCAAAMPCPVRMVTGNHDVYFGEPDCRLQDALAPGTYATGLRHEVIDGVGLIYLDLFARSASGIYRKWIDPAEEERVDYRPEDVATALDLLAAHPDTPWLVLAHFPMCAPDSRIQGPGRKMGLRWPGGAPLAAQLEQPGNLAGIICGHQHFAHFQPFAHGFHWTLPALVEYPCAAALLTWEGSAIRGEIVTVDEGLAERSLRARQATWTRGAAEDRSAAWQVR